VNKPNIQFCPLCGRPVKELPIIDGTLHPTCTHCGWRYFSDPKAAVAIFVLKEDQVLLVKRGIDPMKGSWALPAGYVNAYEDPARAAERETLEETGLVVHVNRLVDVVGGREFENSADIVVVYQAEIVGGVLAAHDDAVEVGFFDRDKLPPLAFRATRIALGLESNHY
jgi:ADP-ribose pyrophosphatase YjhB (NUDIX family)